MANKNRRKVIDKVLSGFGVVMTIALLAIGGLAWWGYSFSHNNVHDQLAEQKIFFPPTIRLGRKKKMRLWRYWTPGYFRSTWESGDRIFMEAVKSKRWSMLGRKNLVSNMQYR